MKAYTTSAVRVLILTIFLSLLGCSEDIHRDASSDSLSQAEEVIQEAQRAHGSNKLDQSVVSFEFRGKQFTAWHGVGGFRYVRTYENEAGESVREVLTRDSLYREVNGVRADLEPNEKLGLETVLNSVVYFAELPEALTDPSVKSRYLVRDSVEGETYDKIEVTFEEQGGGRDWEDRFVYWIHAEKRTIDYLAYFFHAGAGGARFRKAVNPRTVEGIRFQDYINYKAATDTLEPADVDKFDRIMREGGLEHVSDVILENMRIRRASS